MPSSAGRLPSESSRAARILHSSGPWWSQSGTYQQVHDASDLLDVLGGNLAPLIGSIGSRKDGTIADLPAARTLEPRISMGITTATAQSASSNLATNLPTPTVVLPYTTVNLPLLSLVSVPNPLGWNFLFQVPFA